MTQFSAACVNEPVATFTRPLQPVLFQAGDHIHTLTAKTNINLIFLCFSACSVQSRIEIYSPYCSFC